MEKQSLNSPSLRRRNNRPSGGGNRNSNRNRNRGGRNRNSSSGGGRNSGNRNRSQGGGGSRNRSRRRPEPKQTTGQKILSVLTFGLLGKPKKKTRPKSKTAEQPKQTQRQQARAKEAANPKAPAKKRRNRTEVTSGRLYVGNLSYDTSENELEELFRGIGNVSSAEVVTNSRTQQSKGFAFVEMASIDEAKRAVEVLDDQDFMGRKLIVSGARSEGPREGEEEEGSEASDSSGKEEVTSSDDAEEEQPVAGTAES
ncbi:MAG: RNA-binding protein [Verrucomicrobiales bacterium]|nr:RNA-binding protein [Verrucomicrobiales bacterium]